MPANLENSAVATGLEKVSFHSNPKDRQCQRMLKLLFLRKVESTTEASPAGGRNPCWAKTGSEISSSYQTLEEILETAAAAAFSAVVKTCLCDAASGRPQKKARRIEFFKYTAEAVCSQTRQCTISNHETAGKHSSLHVH